MIKMQISLSGIYIFQRSSFFMGQQAVGRTEAREKESSKLRRERMSFNKSTHLEIRPYSAEILRHGYYALVIQFRYARSNYYTFRGALSEPVFLSS